RIPQGAELTEAGRAFLENAEVIPRQAERAIRAAQRAARGEIGSLRVGFTDSAPFNPVVTSIIRSFRRAYPEGDLTLEESYSSRLVAGLRQGELDAVFLRRDDGADDLKFRRLAKEPMLAVLPASLPVAKSIVIDLIRLKGNALILTPRRSTWFDTAIRACR